MVPLPRGTLMAAHVLSLPAAPPTSCGWKWKPPSTPCSRRSHEGTEARGQFSRTPAHALLVNSPAEVFMHIEAPSDVSG